jgi:tetratricopeptide (TPR) repeat protein
VPSWEELPESNDDLLAFANQRNHETSTLRELQTAVSAYEALLERTSDEDDNSPLRFDVYWRMARSIFRCSEKTAAASEKMQWIFRGEEVSDRIMALWPDRVEGYYYSAVFKGRRAENSKIGFSVMKLAEKVAELGHRAMELDETYEAAGPLRLLAMLYAKAPPWPTSIGDIELAREYAEKAIELFDYPMNWLILAEVCIEDDELDQARVLLDRVISAPRTGRWAAEGLQWRPHAIRLRQRVQ